MTDMSDAMRIPLAAFITIHEPTGRWMLDLSGTLNGQPFHSTHFEPRATPLRQVPDLPTVYNFAAGNKNDDPFSKLGFLDRVGAKTIHRTRERAEAAERRLAELEASYDNFNKRLGGLAVLLMQRNEKIEQLERENEHLRDKNAALREQLRAATLKNVNHDISDRVQADIANWRAPLEEKITRLERENNNLALDVTQHNAAHQELRNMLKHSDARFEATSMECDELKAANAALEAKNESLELVWTTEKRANKRLRFNLDDERAYKKRLESDNEKLKASLHDSVNQHAALQARFAQVDATLNGTLNDLEMLAVGKDIVTGERMSREGMMALAIRTKDMLQKAYVKFFPD